MKRLAVNQTTVKDHQQTNNNNTLGSCQRTEKVAGYEVDGNNNNSWCTRNRPQDSEKTLEGLKIREKIETIQTTAFSRILRTVLETLETSCPSDSRERTPTKSGIEKLTKSEKTLSLTQIMPCS